MPDPNVTLTTIETHGTVLERAIHRHGANASRCKAWSGAMVAGMLLLAGGKAQMAALPWAAGVVVLLALADAGQVALARIFTEAYNRFMAKVPLNGGNALKPEEWLVLPAPALSLREAGQVLGALGSFSVWPFYGALLALVVAFHVQTSPPGPSASRVKSAGCSAGGGCGTTGGCGSGGCGASAGKGCGCGSGSADTANGKAAVKAAVNHSSQPAKVTSRPLSTLNPQLSNPPQPATRVSPSANGAQQPGSGVLQLPNRATQFPNRPVQFPIQPLPPGTTAPQPVSAPPRGVPSPASPVQSTAPEQPPALPVQPASPQPSASPAKVPDAVAPERPPAR